MTLKASDYHSLIAQRRHLRVTSSGKLGHEEEKRARSELSSMIRHV